MANDHIAIIQISLGSFLQKIDASPSVREVLDIWAEFNFVEAEFDLNKVMEGSPMTRTHGSASCGEVLI